MFAARPGWIGRASPVLTREKSGGQNKLILIAVVIKNDTSPHPKRHYKSFGVAETAKEKNQWLPLAEVFVLSLVWRNESSSCKTTFCLSRDNCRMAVSRSSS